MLLATKTAAEFADAVRSTQRVLAIGARTKPRLSQCDATLISTRALSGITFTALAGTPVREIIAGFDLPKFFVGNLGRYGLLTEITFKVSPTPPRFAPCESRRTTSRRR